MEAIWHTNTSTLTSTTINISTETSSTVILMSTPIVTITNTERTPNSISTSIQTTKRNRTCTNISRAGIALALALRLSAHDLYLMPGKFIVQPGASLRVEFHNGDSFPESEVAPRVKRLVQASLLSSSGEASVTHLRETGKIVAGAVKVPGAGNLILAVRTVPNFIELDSKKFDAYLKEEGLQDVMQWRLTHHEQSKPGRERYTKFAKSILVAGKPDDYYKHAVGFVIEIIPEANPYTVESSGKLPVQIFLRGQPAPGLQVELASATAQGSQTTIVGRTGEDGRISVPLRGHGRYRIHSLRMQRCSEPAVADWESFWASLTFEVP